MKEQADGLGKEAGSNLSSNEQGVRSSSEAAPGKFGKVKEWIRRQYIKLVKDRSERDPHRAMRTLAGGLGGEKAVPKVEPETNSVASPHEAFTDLAGGKLADAITAENREKTEDEIPARLEKGEEPADDRETENEHPLAKRFKVVRTVARERIDKFKTTLEIASQPEPLSKEPATPENLEARMAELSSEELNTADSIVKWGQLVREITIAQETPNERYREMQYKYELLLKDIMRGNSNIQSLGKSKNPFTRFEEFVTKIGLNSDQRKYVSKAEALRIQINTEKDNIDILQRVKDGSKQKFDKAAVSGTLENIGAINGGYEDVLVKVMSEGKVADEIRSAFIREKIRQFALEKGLSDEKKQGLYTAFNNYLESRSDQEKSSFGKLDFDRTFPEWRFSSFEESCRPIFEGMEKSLIMDIFATAEVKDVKELIGSVWRRVEDPNFRFYENYLHQIKETPESDNVIAGYRKKLVEILDFDLSHRNKEFGFPDMNLWRSIKQSPTAMEVFGDIIRERDDFIHAYTLKTSLDDRVGEHIDRLVYYPTPEGIRNLVILAAADYENYRTVHANNVLSDLAERDDWKELLDKAEERYPSLKSARPVLNSWNFRFQSNKPGLKDAVKDFTFAISQDANETEEVRTKAVLASPNSSLLEILVQRGVLKDEKAVNALNEAEKYLYDLEQSQRRAIEKDEKTDIPNLDYDLLSIQLGKQLKGLCLYGDQESVVMTHVPAVLDLAVLSRKILDEKENDKKNNYEAIKFLRDANVIQKIAIAGFKGEQIETFLSAYKDCPALSQDHNLLEEFVKQYTGRETINFFNKMLTAYGEKGQQLIEILKLVTKESLSQTRALELPSKANEALLSVNFSMAVKYPDVYLATDKDVVFFKKMSEAYKENNNIFEEMSKLIEAKMMNRELALVFPKQASAYMTEEMEGMRRMILQNADTLIHDESDLKFLNKVAGEFGKKSDLIIKGYIDCLKDGVINYSEKEIVLEFGRHFRVISPMIIKGFKEAKKGGLEGAYIAQLNTLAEKMTGTAKITHEERAKPYYKDLLKHVYPNNSGQWSSYENNESCGDRSTDLEGLTIQPRYDIDLLSQSQIRIKEGMTLEPKVQEEMSAPVYKVAERMQKAGQDTEKVKQELNQEMESKLKEITSKGGLRGINLDEVRTPEERLFLILTDSIYGTRSTDPAVVKNLMMTYEFANFEDVSDYIKGTNDRVARAGNRDYALLCELGQFYSDRIKEVNRRLVESAWNNPAIAKLMPEYFRKLSEETLSSERLDKINRLQVDRLGLNDNFVTQIGKVLEKRKGRKYEPDEIRELISRYESRTHGLSEKASESKNPLTRAFYGQIRSQREKTLEAMRVITGDEVDPSSVHLGEVNLKQIQETEANLREGKYDKDQFASYTAQRFIDVFEDERVKIDGELSKFESESGKDREVLHGYITKSKESANARMVGGVCVAGDNPHKNPSQNMWDMSNYFQLVLQAPDTLQCQGLVLLHQFTQGDKKVLTASLNPSSTYLYSVDEGALFTGIMSSLEAFASENKFDMIILPQNKTMRTNRTGGQFEKSIDAQVAKVNKTFKFETPQQFSYQPNYQMQDLDVVWEKPAAA